MSVIRGSTQGLYGIKEATYGTTPATPTLLELPFVTLSPKHSHDSIRSEQMRSHPYLDRLMAGRTMHEIGMEFELQSAAHDTLFETIFGGAITSKVLKYADALKGMTLENRVGGGSSLFNQFTGAYFNRLDVACSANDKTPVKCTVSGMALAGTLDAGATIATAVTAAGTTDPYTFVDADLKIAGTSRQVVSGSFSIERQVDPLTIWGAANPREFVPGGVTATGTIVIPYDDATISTIWMAFADNALIYNLGAPAAATFRKFTFYRARTTGLGRQIQTRAGVMQEVNWEAMYSSSDATMCSMTTE